MERRSRVMVFLCDESGEFRPAGEYADLAEALTPAEEPAGTPGGPFYLLPLEEPGRWPDLVRELVSSYDLLFLKTLEVNAGVADLDPEGFVDDLEARIERSKARQG